MQTSSAGQSWLRRHALVLFLLVSYTLMVMLVVQQDRTIDSQRTLIRQLFHDSMELNARKVREVSSKLR